jgi:hypothetical protein
MDPRNRSGSESERSFDAEQPAEEPQAPASQPAPLIPEIVPADQPLQRETPAPDFSTVGTGSVFAISCTLLTFLIIFVCVAFFILFRVF